MRTFITVLAISQGIVIFGIWATLLYLLLYAAAHVHEIYKAIGIL